jgi:hypothetical protein
MKTKSSPGYFPLANTVMWITAGSYWQIPGWAWGVLGCLIVSSWVVCVLQLLTRRREEPNT